MYLSKCRSIIHPSRNPSPSCNSSYQMGQRKRRIQHPLVKITSRNSSRTPIFSTTLLLKPAQVRVKRGAGEGGQNQSLGGLSCTLRETCNSYALWSRPFLPPPLLDEVRSQPGPHHRPEPPPDWAGAFILPVAQDNGGCLNPLSDPVC
jgi:hypothetical protein